MRASEEGREDFFVVPRCGVRLVHQNQEKEKNSKNSSTAGLKVEEPSALLLSHL
ncbi:MAG: hypothetical protein LUQ19_03365 [Methanoregula sp.]|nr:hypothetical protein [Methanoregula sp.]